MLDEECRVPKGSDDSLLGKMHIEFVKHECYQKPLKEKNSFCVRHFAGDVSVGVGRILML